MGKTVDYKQKYYALRDQMIRSIDFAYRSGFEAAMKEAQVQQAQMQMQQMQAQMQQMKAAQMQAPGAEMPEENQMPEGGDEAQMAEQGQMEQEGGSELDQHIQALEEAISKSEGKAKESLEKALVALKKSSEYSHSHRLSKEAVPFKLSANASKKLSSEQKEQLSMQHKILNDVLAKWEKESQEAVSDINRSLNQVLVKHDHD
jgi:hypothetical protein